MFFWNSLAFPMIQWILAIWSLVPLHFLFFFFLFIFISWRLITLQYCSDFCHTLTWTSHGFTCFPHPDPPPHLPPHPIPMGLPSAPAPSTCLMYIIKGETDHQPRLDAWDKCSAFSKTSLNIWKFSVHELLKPGLENFEHYFASM